MPLTSPREQIGSAAHPPGQRSATHRRVDEQRGSQLMHLDVTNSPWAPLPFERLVANHPGGVRLTPTPEVLQHCGVPDNEGSMAGYLHSWRFATAGPYPLIELTCQVLYCPRGVLF